MPLYVCRFCDYNIKDKQAYYLHLYKHINENNASFDKEEIELCTVYHNKMCQYKKEYRLNNKDQICQKDKEYYQNNRDKELHRKKEYYENNRDKLLQRFKEYRKNNRDKIKQYKKEYDLNKKLEKEEANVLDVYDSD
jgi:hypothetical protein